jgi:hypothetical protein
LKKGLVFLITVIFLLDDFFGQSLRQKCSEFKGIEPDNNHGFISGKEGRKGFAKA